MLTPKQKEFVLKTFKMTDSTGVFAHWTFGYSCGGESHADDLQVTRTPIPAKSLTDLLKLMRDMVVTCEDMDYAKKALELPGLKPSKEVQQAIDGSLLDKKSKITVTGVKLVGAGDKEKCTITYKITTTNSKKPKGASTAQILLSSSIYGFEEELEGIIEQLKIEVFKYLYEDNFASKAQLTLYPPEMMDDEGKKPEQKTMKVEQLEIKPGAEKETEKPKETKEKTTEVKTTDKKEVKTKETAPKVEASTGKPDQKEQKPTKATKPTKLTEKAAEYPG